ncbi:response regulator [Vogesella oryzae]|uniref:response regulator n=1 Tax=Vogesella oryzae TaxID=1735285 RepID=UPI001581A5CF|nr:response regulator [Vogesella oryzae]
MLQAIYPPPTQLSDPGTIRVLVVDDDDEIRELICQYLGNYAIGAVGVANGEAMQAALAEQRFDAIVLDLMLPGENGLSLCKRVRSHSTVPILMISAHGDPTERIISLEVGADDFLTKPFDIRELVARIHSVLRRTRQQHETAASAPAAPDRLSFGDWQLHLTLRQLQDRDGTVVPLSNAEFRLLSAMLQRPRTVLDRDQLLDLTRGSTVEVFDRSIDILISRLRGKLRDDPRSPRLIRTVRGEGYMLDAQIRPL